MGSGATAWMEAVAGESRSSLSRYSLLPAFSSNLSALSRIQSGDAVTLSLQLCRLAIYDCWRSSSDPFFGYSA